MLQKPKSLLEIMIVRLEQDVPKDNNEAPGPNPTGCLRADEFAQAKAKTRISCWNVWTLFYASKLAQLANELRRYLIAVFGVSERGEVEYIWGDHYIHRRNMSLFWQRK